MQIVHRDEFEIIKTDLTSSYFARNKNSPASLRICRVCFSIPGHGKNGLHAFYGLEKAVFYSFECVMFCGKVK